MIIFSFPKITEKSVMFKNFLSCFHIKTFKNWQITYKVCAVPHRDNEFLLCFHIKTFKNWQITYKACANPHHDIKFFILKHNLWLLWYNIASKKHVSNQHTSENTTKLSHTLQLLTFHSKHINLIDLTNIQQIIDDNIRTAQLIHRNIKTFCISTHTITLLITIISRTSSTNNIDITYNTMNPTHHDSDVSGGAEKDDGMYV